VKTVRLGRAQPVIRVCTEEVTPPFERKEKVGKGKKEEGQGEPLLGPVWGGHEWTPVSPRPSFKSRRRRVRKKVKRQEKVYPSGEGVNMP